MRGLSPGATVGCYVIEAELARGGMGTVYRARRALDGAVVAVKVLHTGSGASAAQLLRFQREAEVAARLRHPGIVTVHDAGVAGGLPYMAMDLIDGQPLGALAGRVPPLEAARIVAQVARAIEHAHAHDVIHRDLKPDNVLVRHDDGRPVVTDFGIARDLGGDALTRTGALVGTPHYMAPEQAAGRPVDRKCDVHALGAMLHELITGAPPFAAQELGALLMAIAEDRPPAPSRLAHGVPRALDAVVQQALAKVPAARPTAGELAADLEAIAAGRRRPRPHGGRLVRGLTAAAALSSLAAAAALALAARDLAARRAGAGSPTTTTGTGSPATTTATAPWTPPEWVRALERGDEAAILAAHAALDAQPAVDPRARARALELVAELDARWSEPPPGPARADALDLLLWLQWLWRRLDPAHHSPRAVEVMDRNAPWRPDRMLDAQHMIRTARALTAVKPGEVDAYLLYVHHAEHARLPWSDWDGDLVRAGVRVCEDTPGAEAAWGVLVLQLARWLEAAADRGDAAAAAELAALARDMAVEGGRAPEEAGRVITIACRHAARDRLAALTAEEASRLLEAALELQATRRAPSEALIARIAGLADHLHRRAGRLPDAQRVVERALAITPDHPQVGLALRRVLLGVDVSLHPDALWASVADLLLRIDRQLTRRPAGATRLVALQERVRAAQGSTSIRELKAAVAGWRERAALETLDP